MAQCFIVSLAQYFIGSSYFDNKCGSNKGEIHVLLTAPTGTAAFLIEGVTCHSAFSLPTKTSFYHKQSLSEDTANTLRAALQHVKIIIVDEYSMVSNKILGQINRRCQQIWKSDEAFGGKCIILVGDMFQLPPVKASPI